MFGCYVVGLPIESGILPLLKHMCVEKQLAIMLAIKTSAGISPEVDLRECTPHMPLPNVNNALKP